ncbi:hypothetical protein [Demequina litorisediminis]|uniref:Uncharacterized protein n=1 Tax=Demequina litorisediminis TaxID=1849022 RepID=A0ABQ6ID60_9MICO|nr:hypothetical protein [Demequina litorisediminis]GMA35191.1 hypothetical protein GCM10025876_13950 [Demequina litorisediminis]
MSNVPADAPASKRRRWRWVVAGVVAGVAIVVMIPAVLLALDAYRLQGSAADLEAHASGAQQAVTDRDATTLTAEVEALQEAAATFAGATDGFPWWLAARTPWVKDQTVPLQEAGRAVRAVADDALGPLAGLDDLSALEAPPVVDGRVDPDFLEPYRAVLADADAVLSQQVAALGDVNLEGTVDPVRGPFEDLKGKARRDGCARGGCACGGRAYFPRCSVATGRGTTW